VSLDELIWQQSTRKKTDLSITPPNIFNTARQNVKIKFVKRISVAFFTFDAAGHGCVIE